jgi:hypothetical protein
MGENAPTVTSYIKSGFSTTVKYNSLKYNAETQEFTGKIEYIPMMLEYMDCSKCNLTVFPDIIADNIGQINCQINNLVELPVIMPKYLLDLYCYCNRLEYLPNHISYSLRKLWCSKNNIKELPDLPLTIYRLIICNNPISTISEHNKKVITNIRYAGGWRCIFNCRNTPLWSEYQCLY